MCPAAEICGIRLCRKMLKAFPASVCHTCAARARECIHPSIVLSHVNISARARPFDARVRARAGPSIIVANASSMASTVGSTISPASATISGKAPPSETTTGTPQARASRAGRPNPSKRLGRQNAVAPAMSAANCLSGRFSKISGGSPSPALNSARASVGSTPSPEGCVTSTNRCGKPRDESRATARRSRRRFLPRKSVATQIM